MLGYYRGTSVPHPVWPLNDFLSTRMTNASSRIKGQYVGLNEDGILVAQTQDYTNKMNT